MATIVLTALLYEVAAPLSAFALTGGPSQPEFSEFEPVATTSMVNPFTGDFTYNLPVLSIPGANGGGYALSLSYHSGKSGDEEASWVGKGWTLNPGAITRQKRGFPDDYNGKPVKYWNKTETNWTVSIGKKLNPEFFGINPGISVSSHARYNNYKGYSHTLSIGLDVKGVVDLGYSVTDGEGSFSFSVNPAKLLYEAIRTERTNEKSHTPDEVKKAGFTSRLLGMYTPAVSSSSLFGVASFGEENRTTNFPEYTGQAYDFDVAVVGNPAPVPLGLKGGFSASYLYQKNVAEHTSNAFGYMYLAGAGTSGMMDYYVEDDATYNKRDKYLGIPFSNADNFIVSGEGIGGGFRMHHRQAGEFHPASKESGLTTFHMGADIHLGTDFGLGGAVSTSHHSLEVGSWENDDDPDPYTFSSPDQGDEPVFFRFYGDLGGNVTHDDDDAARRADIPGDIVERTLFGANPVIGSSGISAKMNGGKRSGRSSYIGYHTHAEMRQRPTFSCYGSPGPAYPRSYLKSDTAFNYVDRENDLGIRDGIGEFAIVNGDGNRYVYGLPVYARNEADLSFGLDGASVPDGYLAFKESVPSTARQVVGEERDAPYAMAHLLTDITTSDYVDRTNDGPSPDDLGGYTKFNYVRTAGSDYKSGNESTSWYKWRTPYRGLIYNRNSLSDSRDDLGAVSYGEKEIYYLSSIETKTHVAVFYTSARKDGYEAVRDEASATSDPDATTADAGGNKLRKLDSIKLFPRVNDTVLGRVLTTVRLEYDYSLCPNLPNSESDGVSGTVGNLTLKRVYSEYEGAINARTSPYVFGYEYKRSSDYSALPSALKDGKYKDIIEYADHYEEEGENPDYSPYDIDRWGYYRYDGASRAAIFNSWVDQDPDPDQFDPAAWQLKSIKLPSGGEIHVQYEQNDYRYVQNRQAMAMVNLRGLQETDSDGGQVTLHLDLAELGISQTSEIQVLKDTLKARFVTNGERLYFKFLYSLKGGVTDFTSCRAEYISGYVKVKDVKINPGNATDLQIELFEPDEDYQHPQDVAWNFVATSRAGIIDQNGICDPAIRPVQTEEDDPWDHVFQLLAAFNNTFFSKSTTCSKINLEHSYVRIPINRDKKGGGIRVKRLLMYDKGIESGAASLFGTEFIYKNIDGTSSGVATNEPGSGREENALVTYMERREEQGWYNRLISGRDKEEFEGPIGESILPGPSIGYARVVERNIHTGVTGTGHTIHEYFTARDYPFDRPYDTEGDPVPGAANTDMLAKDQLAMVYGLFINYRVNNLFRSQGYRFIQTDMHGKLKKIASYSGDDYNGANTSPVALQEYTYFQPGESIPMMYGIGNIVNENPGKEMDVVFENRSIEDVTTDGSLSLDFTLGLVFIIPIPYGTAFPQLNFGEEKMRTHVTTKVVRYPAIVRSAKVIRDGVTHFSENIGFDPQSGRPILIKTTDGFDGLKLAGSTTAHTGNYYSYNIPASQQYPAMGQVAMRERMRIGSDNGVNIEKRYNNRHYLNFRFITKGAALSTINMLTPGDLIRVYSNDLSLGLYYVGEISGSQVELLPTYISNTSTAALESGVSVEIIRSGRTNQLTVDAGTITTYGQPPAVSNHGLE